MQRCSKNGYFISSICSLIVSGLLLINTGCRNVMGSQEKNQINRDPDQEIRSDGYPDYIKFRCFQNPDSTWGFTIFVNSRPYLSYDKIPVPKSASGFQSKTDAENVAGLFVKMIRKGDLTQTLNKKTTDSLGIVIKLSK